MKTRLSMPIKQNSVVVACCKNTLVMIGSNIMRP